MRRFTGPLAPTALVLAACAAVPRDAGAVPAPLQRYADAAAFLLPGFSSYACFTIPREGADVVRVVCCGSDFEQPRWLLGFGRYRGIEVHDWGPCGASDVPEGPPTETIGGVAVWHHLAETTIPESWQARVDDRFLVTSHQRDLLVQALQRTGRLVDLLRPFDSLPALPDDAESVVYLLPRPGDRTYLGRPVPIESMVASLSASHRLRLCHRQPLPEEFMAFAQHATSPPVTTSREGWQITTMDLSVNDTVRMLMFELLFGLAICF